MDFHLLLAASDVDGLAVGRCAGLGQQRPGKKQHWQKSGHAGPSVGAIQLRNNRRMVPVPPSEAGSRGLPVTTYTDSDGYVGTRFGRALYAPCF